jgi:hypothetical protein
MQKRNGIAGTAGCTPTCPPVHALRVGTGGAPRHIGLIAEAVLAERAAIREAVASAMAAPGTGPEPGGVTRIIERIRAGESPVAIARETGALR